MKRPTTDEVAHEIAALDTLDSKQLQAKWRALLGTDAPAHIRAPLLRRFIAYRLQETAFGGLAPRTQKHLRRLAAEFRASRRTAMAGSDVASPALNRLASAIRLSPGTQLLREWKGLTETVDVTSDGFSWRGQSFRTLSAVATAITGTKWSGPRFFGLKPSKRDVAGAPAKAAHP